MVSLEHVKLLEDRIIRTLDHVALIQQENKQLREKLDQYQVRIDELEVLVKAFKEDQSKIEDGILAALDRLNQFELAVERGINSVSEVPPQAAKPAVSTVPEAQNDTTEEAGLDEEEEALEEKASQSDEDSEFSDISIDEVDEDAAIAPEDKRDGAELDIF